MSGQVSDSADRPELNAFEDALRNLAPAPARLDRDRLLFSAGQAAAGGRCLWPAATFVSMAACVMLAVLLVCRPSQPVVQRVYVPVPTAPADRQLNEPLPAHETGETSVPSQVQAPVGQSPRRRLEEHLLRWGLNGLGEPTPLDPSSMPLLSLSSEEGTQ